MNRKEFISTAARLIILSVMAVLVGVFAFKGKLTGESTCPDSKYCKGCSKLAKCSLPNALKERSDDKG